MLSLTYFLDILVSPQFSVYLGLAASSKSIAFLYVQTFHSFASDSTAVFYYDYMLTFDAEADRGRI